MASALAEQNYAFQNESKFGRVSTEILLICLKHIDDSMSWSNPVEMCAMLENIKITWTDTATPRNYGGGLMSTQKSGVSL